MHATGEQKVQCLPKHARSAVLVFRFYSFNGAILRLHNGMKFYPIKCRLLLAEVHSYWCRVGHGAQELTENFAQFQNVNARLLHILRNF